MFFLKYIMHKNANKKKILYNKTIFKDNMAPILKCQYEQKQYKEEEEEDEEEAILEL